MTNLCDDHDELDNNGVTVSELTKYWPFGMLQQRSSHIPRIEEGIIIKL